MRASLDDYSFAGRFESLSLLFFSVTDKLLPAFLQIMEIFATSEPPSCLIIMYNPELIRVSVNRDLRSQFHRSPKVGALGFRGELEIELMVAGAIRSSIDINLTKVFSFQNRSNRMNFKVIPQEAEEGGYIASCPALPGCHSQGNDAEEAKGTSKRQ